MMKQKRFLPGWDEERVRKDLNEEQTEDEAVAVDEAAFEDITECQLSKPPSI